jgi:glutamine---fructose-6-phosphate transaminase (isomerizing)
MCGIVGIIGVSPVADRVVDSLKRLEYRGYDSAGVATLDNGGHLTRRRAEGKLKNLEARLDLGAAPGHDRHRPHALGHPRRPNESNAHPHATDKLAVVHNGIIENYPRICARCWQRRVPSLSRRPTPKSSPIWLRPK